MNKSLTAIKKLQLDGSVNPLLGQLEPPPVEKLVIHFKDKVIFDNRAIKGTAEKKDVETTGDCSSKHRLARGSVVANAAPILPVVKAALNVCITERQANDSLSLTFAAVYKPLGIVIAVPGRIKLNGGKLVLEADTKLSPIVGVQPVIRTIGGRTKDIKRKVKGKTVHLFNNPTHCPKSKKWSATLTLTFAANSGAEPLTVTDSTKCKSAKK